MDFPFFGDLCSSLDAIREEKCNPNLQAIMGGEPGAMEQWVWWFQWVKSAPIIEMLIVVNFTRPEGMYHIRLVPDPDLWRLLLAIVMDGYANRRAFDNDNLWIMIFNDE